MSARLLALTGAALSAPGKGVWALAVALAMGAIALVSPVLAVLLLGILTARVLMRADIAPRIDLVAIAGPGFAVLLVGAFFGLAAAVGAVFAWRVVVDTNWSVREAARLADCAGRPDESNWRALLHAWLTPAYGLTLVAYSAPHMVAGLPLDLPHAPAWVPILAGGIAAIVAFDWALKRAADWRLGELASAPVAHLASHHVLFVLAFGLSGDVSAGLVALIAWRLAHASPRARQASFTAVP